VKVKRGRKYQGNDSSVRVEIREHVGRKGEENNPLETCKGLGGYSIMEKLGGTFNKKKDLMAQSETRKLWSTKKGSKNRGISESK